MPTSYTSLLGFALPVTGELQGTWGTTVNDSITELVEDAIAATATASVTSGNWTLSTTGSGSANEARCAILIPTGTPGVSRNIVAPSQSKAYVVINQSDAVVVLKGLATTGTTIAASTKALCAWDGADFVTIATADVGNLVGTVPVSKGGTGQTTYTDGQLLIGNSTGNTLAKSTLTAGSGVSITNGSGSITISATGSGGDVVGPASATDTAVALFDGTTGKLLKNSAVTVGTTGNTVISGTDNSNAMLRITQLGTGNALVVEDSANPDSTPFVVDASGKVVSGNTTAYSATSGIIPQIASVGNTNGTASMGIGRFSADVSQGYYVFTKSRSATLGTFGSIVSNGDAIGTLLWTADDGTSVPIQAASITAFVDGAPGAGDMPGRLVFSTTADGASSPTERMRIDSAGNVGIGGTAAAGVTLQVSKNATGSTNTRGVTSGGTIQSDSTASYNGFRSSVTTAAASFTLADLSHFVANQNTLGAGSTVTAQYGFNASSTLTGATNNYGFYSNIASGTGRWNFYANGTAANYFGGQVQLDQDYIEKRFTANSGTSITLDLANGTMQDITLTGSPTITMPTAVAGKSFILLLRSGAGSYAVTWSTVKWPGGTAPTVTTTASRLDIYSFFSDGTNWYGVTVNQNYTP